MCQGQASHSCLPGSIAKYLHSQDWCHHSIGSRQDEGRQMIDHLYYCFEVQTYVLLETSLILPLNNLTWHPSQFCIFQWENGERVGGHSTLLSAKQHGEFGLSLWIWAATKSRLDTWLSGIPYSIGRRIQWVHISLGYIHAYNRVYKAFNLYGYFLFFECCQIPNSSTESWYGWGWDADTARTYKFINLSLFWGKLVQPSFTELVLWVINLTRNPILSHEMMRWPRCSNSDFTLHGWEQIQVQCSATRSWGHGNLI